MKKSIHIISLATLLLFPLVSFAALGGVKDLLVGFQALLVPLESIIFGLALIFFFWGMGQFILKDAGNDKTREEGKKKMLWSIIALFVMFSIMGILAAIGSTVGIPLAGATSGRSGSGCTSTDQAMENC